MKFIYPVLPFMFIHFPSKAREEGVAPSSVVGVAPASTTPRFSTRLSPLIGCVWCYPLGDGRLYVSEAHCVFARSSTFSIEIYDDMMNYTHTDIFFILLFALTAS